MTELEKAKQERGFPILKTKTEVEKAQEQAGIELARAKRKDAAIMWAAKFSEKSQKVRGSQKRALAVIALDKDIFLWLAENQPMALRQAQEALDGTSYCDYLPKN